MLVWFAITTVVCRRRMLYFWVDWDTADGYNELTEVVNDVKTLVTLRFTNPLLSCSHSDNNNEVSTTSLLAIHQVEVVHNLSNGASRKVHIPCIMRTTV